MSVGVPAEHATARDFMMVRAALVKTLGGANEALVWTRIDFRLQMRQPPYVDEESVAWWPASLDLLADETGLSRDQVKRALQGLLTAGHLAATEHRLGGNYDRTKSYRTVVSGRHVDVANSPHEIGRNRHQDVANSPHVPSIEKEEEERRAPRAKKPEIPLPGSWVPTAEHYARAKDLGVNVVAESESFRLHAEAHDRRAANWNAAFTMWLKKARPSEAVRTAEQVRVADDERARRDAWLSARGITLDEYRDHYEEPGWLESVEARYQERRRA